VAVEDQPDGRERYLSPHSFADNCREVRVFDPSVSAYKGIKVCDVLELNARN
jgi:hypothetical protein